MTDKSHTLEQLFLGELKDIYDAEKQLVKALPKLAKVASNPELRNGIEEHFGQSKEHVARIEQIFDLFGARRQGRKCVGIQGILTEGNEILGDVAGGTPVQDAALILSAQKVGHYQIATYGTLCSWASLLGQDRAAELLHQSLNEERTVNHKLSELATNSVNAQAAHAV